MKKAIAFFAVTLAGSFTAGLYIGRKSAPTTSNNRLFVLDELIRNIKCDQATQTDFVDTAKAAVAAAPTEEVRLKTPRAPLMRQAASSVNSEDEWSKPSTPAAPPPTPEADQYPSETPKNCCMM